MNKKIAISILIIVSFLVGSAASYRINLDLFKSSSMSIQALNDFHAMRALYDIAMLIDNNRVDEARCAAIKYAFIMKKSVQECIDDKDCRLSSVMTNDRKSYIETADQLEDLKRSSTGCATP